MTKKTEIDSLVVQHNAAERAHQAQIEADRAARASSNRAEMLSALRLVFDDNDISELQINVDATSGSGSETRATLTYEGRVYTLRQVLFEGFPNSNATFVVACQGESAGAPTPGQILEAVARIHIKLERKAGR